jgi:hypothetical protein
VIDPVMKEWHVAFVPSSDPRWYWWRTFLLKAKYEHCYVFGYDQNIDVWVVMEWLSTGIEICHSRGEEIDNLVVITIERGGFILRAETQSVSQPYPRFSFSYCVTGIKHLLNLHGWWIHTPDQLFRALLKIGARVSFPKTTHTIRGILYGNRCNRRNC